MSDSAKAPRSSDRKAQAEHNPKGFTLSSEEHERLLSQADEAQRYKDQYLRALAELENARKRFERDREEYVRFASEELMHKLLPILDSFESALTSTPAGTSEHEAVNTGVRLIYRKLMDLLEKEGLKRIDAQGAVFDPHLHEAVEQVETNGTPEDTVVEIVHVGYTYRNRVIRPALVKVAKPPAQTTDPRPQTTGNEEEQPEV